MGKSWGHGARLLTEHERQFRGRWGCARRGCKEAPAVMVSYRYATGQAARESSNGSAVCELHGRRFAAKYGVEIGPAPKEEPTNAIEQFLGQLHAGEFRSG